MHALLRRSRRVGALLLLLPLLVSCAVVEKVDWQPAENTSNGVALMSPSDALRSSRRAMTNLRDVTYRGTVVFRGVSPARWRVRIRSGRDGACEIRWGASGASFTFRMVDGVVYQSASEKMMRSYWEYPERWIDQLVGAWWTVPADEVGTFPACGLGSIVPGPQQRGRYDTAGFVEVRKVWSLKFEIDDDRRDDWIAVATEGEPLVVAMVQADGPDRYRLELTGTDKGKGLGAPPPSRVLDLGDESGATPVGLLGGSRVPLPELHPLSRPSPSPPTAATA